MKAYTSANPVFSTSIQIVEATDPAHADNINESVTQLLQNTLVLKNEGGGQYTTDEEIDEIIDGSYGEESNG